jgi:hypothetical protein
MMRAGSDSRTDDRIAQLRIGTSASDIQSCP